MSSVIKFGTDGWRGIIAQDFTFDNVRVCAQSVAEYLQATGLAHRGLVIGYDTRFASEYFAAAVAEVVAANGIKAYLCDKATPTPVISHGVLERKAAGAVIITASHNPAIWNGFKFKTEDGASAPTEVEAELEKRIPQILSQDRVRRLPLGEGVEKGLIEYFDLAPAYLHRIAELTDLESLRQAGLKVVVDSMYGAGSGYFKALLTDGNTQVIEINGERNPLFPGIQPEPIAANLAKLSQLVRESKADVGLATDGDADRLGIVDEKGGFLTPLQIFALLALYLLEVLGERGAIVKTPTTTSMLYRLGEIYRVPVYETPIGFKYVAPKMMAEDALIGGEESGGYGFRGHIPERDGILAGIYFLSLMTKLGKTPTQLIGHLYSQVGPHHYQRIDLDFSPTERERIIHRLAQTKPASLASIEVIKIDTFDGFHFVLADGSWLLVRFSGTEPVLRIYAESDSIEQAGRLVEAGRDLVGI